MRKLVAAFVAVTLALTLSACGGGGEDTATKTTESAPAPTAGTAAASQPAVVPLADNSPTQTAAYEPLVKEGVTPPPSVEQRIKSKQPFILAFYDDAQPVTADQKKIVSSVMKKYRGMVELVSFDLGKYSSQSSTGTPEVSSKLLKDKTAVQAQDLAESIGVKFLPYIVVVDKNGYTTYRGAGLVDGGTLEREVLRVGE